MNRLTRPAAVPLRLLPALLLSVLLPACLGGSTTTAGRANCNGELDLREDEVDDLFDVDGDGYFDASNPGCQEVYSAEILDCNDSDPDINPGMDETTCNGIDDDCDEGTLDEIDEDEDGYSLCDEDCDDDNADVAPGYPEEICDGLDNDCDPETSDGDDLDGDGWTECDDCVETNPAINPGMDEVTCDGIDNDCNSGTPDGSDLDGDGSTDCFDCNDEDPSVFPGNPEVCEDGIDQNCDGQDAECTEETWTGTWSTNAVSYNCGGGNVVIDFQTISIQDSSPDIDFIFVGGLHPGSVSGTVDGSGDFNAAVSYGGLCTKTFTFDGSFVGNDNFTATLTADVSNCSGCSDQSWSVTGSR